MIIGIISFLIDYLILNNFDYYIGNIIIFPMFSLVYIISYLYLKNKYNVFFFLLYIFINGIIFLPLFIIFLNSFIKSKTSYFLTIIVSLIIHDFMFYLFLSINDITLLINKIIVTIPINLLYALIIYHINYVLKDKKNKYKLVW